MRTGNRIPDLAVIIPARNEASRLGGCLGSVRQALECAEVTEAEVIVVDDDSTDETSDVARAHWRPTTPGPTKAGSLSWPSPGGACPLRPSMSQGISR